MDVLSCGHPARRSEQRMCPHLVGPEAGPAHHRLLRGTGLDADLLCPRCAGDVTTVELVEVCEGCAERVGGDEWEMLGWRGAPGVAERIEDVAVEDRSVAVDLTPLSDRALAALGDGWLCWTTDEVLVALDGDGVPIAEYPVPPIAEDPELRGRVVRALHVSPDGRWAACVDDRGRFGRVVDLVSGEVATELDRGTVHPETTAFPVAFVRHGAGCALIAATAWNRLDARDLVTGASLTDRSTERRHLGRFHGRLLMSPTGRWIADDGWVWHPIGVPRTFDLGVWLATNRWEAEDGPSVADLCSRAYLWGAPMCWVGGDLLAISGIGPDADFMLDGVRIFDVAVPTQVIAFAGPSGRLWSLGGDLFSSEPDGLHRWDPRTGERTARLPGVDPHALAAERATFAAVRDGHLLTWRLA